MEVLIVNKDFSLGWYDKLYSDNTKMNNLGEFLCNIKPNYIETWLKNPVNTGTEEVSFGIKGNNVEIYRYQFFFTDEEIDFYYDNRFIISFSKFVDAAKKWIELTAQKPEFIIIKFVNDDLILEPDFRDEIAVNMENVKLAKGAICRLFIPEIRDGSFYGGLHALEADKKNDFELKNKLLDKENTMSFDVEFKNDFTFNHSFFSSPTNCENFMEYLETFLKEKASKKMFILRDRDISVKKTDDTILLRFFRTGFPSSAFIFDKNLNLLTCFPIFRRPE